MGEGAVESGWTGVIFTKDDLVDFAGKQKASSLEYAQLLHRFTGARIHNFAPKEHYVASYPFFKPHQ